jgi:hypothetical protein
MKHAKTINCHLHSPKDTGRHVAQVLADYAEAIRIDPNGHISEKRGRADFDKG